MLSAFPTVLPVEFPSRTADLFLHFCSFDLFVFTFNSPSKMVSVENSALKGGGALLKQKVWDASRDTIQQWTGQRLADVSLYGIRIYETDSILAPHVDRLPLVSSAIINVDQDVDEPWYVEIV